MLAQALSYAPNVNVAVISAARLLRLLDRVPQYIEPSKQPVSKALVKYIAGLLGLSDLEFGYCLPQNVKGNVNFVDVEFSYPTRRDDKILKKLNLAVEAGKTIALVGPSGCGKSTCIQLLLRYYDAEEGYVELDGTKTTDYTLECLRSQIGLVSQEPVLFDRTISENIAYGDNSREVPMDEIVKAAQQANIHAFVTKLPAVSLGCFYLPFAMVLYLYLINDWFNRATTRDSVAAELNCRVVRSSALLSLGRWCATPRSCCSTRPRRRSTDSPR